MTGAAREGLTSLFRPRSIAVIGASADPAKIGGKPIANLLEYGFTGLIHPVNPRHREIQGLPAHADIAAVPGEIDVAVLAIPAPGVLDALAACAARGVKAAVVFSSGFAETGAAGAAAQREMGALSRRTGMRILGPNCLGLINVAGRAVLTFGQAMIAGLPEPEGMSIVSQSGAFGTFTFVAATERGLPVDLWVSTGNEADVDFADCVDWLADDPQTRVIMGYMEGCRNGAALLRALAKARAAGKPVVVMKVGRSEAGAAAAQSHTAALAGADAIYDAAFRQSGVYRAATVDEFLDVGYACLIGNRPRGPKLGILTMSGGAGVLMADTAEAAGLDVRPEPEAAQAAMLDIVPFAGVRNPVDVTGQVAADPTLFRRFGEVMIAAGGYDAIVAFHGVAGLAEASGAAVLASWQALRARFPDLPLALAMRCLPALRRQIEALGIAVFDEPTRMVRAMAALAGFAAPNGHGSAPPSHGTATLPAGNLSEAEATRLLADAGIAMAPHRVAASADAAVAAADTFGYPVVLKVASPDIIHKSDIGGVALDLPDAAAVREAFARVTQSARAALPGARLDGAVVAPMLRGGVEAVIGALDDPVFGPVVMVGLGGVFVEVLKDVAFRVAPIGVAEAHRMIGELRGKAMLHGLRGRPAADIDALAEALACLSVFAAAHGGGLITVEINPLLVRARGQGAIGLDAVMVGASKRSREDNR